MLPKFTALLLFAALPQSPSVSAADPTLPPATAPVLFAALGTGVQIYVCAAAAPASARWVLQAPQATLTDAASGRRLGTHTAGPTWTWSDGSSVHGVVVAKLASPEPDSVPWLLLAAQPAGGERHGALRDVTWVRRSETHGGNAPAGGCDAEHVGASVRVPYRATYTFLGSAAAAGH